MIEVRVVFSGIVLTVLHPETQESAVLMPDCREGIRDGRSSLVLEDGTTGSPHVGYLRFNLANLDGVGNQFPRGDDANGPSFEVVHRLRREELVFDVAPEEWDTASAKRTCSGAPSASFNEIAPGLLPKPDAFESQPGRDVLFRTLLLGGTLEGVSLGRQWVFPSTLLSDERRRCRERYRGAFANSEFWIRDLDREDLPMRLVSLDGQGETRIRLLPDENNVITIKLANLCSHDVLEWPEFKPLPADEDLDFKWYYRLLALNPTSLVGSELPHPRADDSTVISPAGEDTCGKASVVAPFTYEPEKVVNARERIG